MEEGGKAWRHGQHGGWCDSAHKDIQTVCVKEGRVERRSDGNVGLIQNTKSALLQSAFETLYQQVSLTVLATVHQYDKLQDRL